MPWDLMPGAAIDIGVDGQGAAWVVGTDNEVYRWNEASGGWSKVNINLSPKRISCGKVSPIVCSKDGIIQRYDVQTETWETLRAVQKMWRRRKTRMEATLLP